MPIQHFSKVFHDELLVSAIARSARQLRITEDKVALEYFFGSRNIVPSPLFQGHLWQLLSRIGHIWQVNIDDVIQNHTLLPIFRPFVEPERYQQLIHDLTASKTSPALFRSGVNASLLVWPSNYKVCPVCWQEQKAGLGVSYWQRLFQCSGVECCPQHRCSLVDTGLKLKPPQRHHLVGTHEVKELPAFSVVASSKDFILSQHIASLLSYQGPVPSFQQWSCYYKVLCTRFGYVKNGRIEHARIKEQLIHYWGHEWLRKYGLPLDVENHWLLAMFRSHRRSFSYMQHIACWMALDDSGFNVHDVIRHAASLTGVESQKKHYFSSKSDERKDEYRQAWLEQLRVHSSLKAIRADRKGASLYSWLYRFDNSWLATHKPARIQKNSVAKVNWQQRDKQLVTALLHKMYRTEDDLLLPRKSKAWYARQVNAEAVWQRHQDKLPLCKAFMDRYAESIDEYQTRRLAAVMIELISNQRNAIARSEIERLCGLSKKRCRPAARKIIEYHLPTWQSYKEISVPEQA